MNNQNQNPGSSDKLLGKKSKLLLFGKDRREDIIIDSGVSHHMMGDLQLLTDVVQISPCPITLPNGNIPWATRQDSLNFGGQLILDRVFYASCLSITLIFVAQLLRDLDEFVLFTMKFCVIQDLTSKTLIGAGRERDGVYHYEGVVAVQAGHVQTLQSRDLWHRWPGHPSSKVLSVLGPIGGFSSGLGVFENSCGICRRAKQTRNTFSASRNKTIDSFCLIHCDLWGPYRKPSTSGARYFLTIADDYSRAVWTILLLEKRKHLTL